MKKIVLEWWRTAVTGIIFGLLVFVVITSSDAGYITVQVLMLFCVLFFGYRFGPGVGAVMGSISGIVMAMVSHEFTQMGIMCLLGVFAGAFRGLGRMASVTAYTVAAFGAGVLYSPALLFSTMEAAMAGGAVFMLLPRKLTQPQVGELTQQKDGLRVLPQSGAVKEAAQVFDQLAQLYRNNRDNEAGVAGKDSRYWNERYIELKLLAAEQLGECAGILTAAASSMEKWSEADARIKRAFEEKLGAVGAKVHAVYVSADNAKRKELVLTLSTRTARCISVKLICKKLSEVMGRRMIPLSDQPLIISSTPRNIRFREDCIYYTLYSSAGRTGSSSAVSGDCFSCLELDDARLMLIICDGMGSGEEASKDSVEALELAEQMAKAGFSASMIVRSINSALIIQGKERPITLDICIIDRHTGMCDITKSGAAVTFCKNADRVDILQADTLPAGILMDNAPVQTIRRLNDHDMLIMVSDGVIEALSALDKEEVLSRFISTLTGENPKEMAAEILSFAAGTSSKRDDMTVLVAGIWKK